ncbi:MAG: YciI family protein [Acidimicrobiales bacterium]
MLYTVLLYDDPDHHDDFAPGTPEFDETVAAWTAFNKSLADRGHLISGARCTNAPTSVFLSVDGTRQIVDGPHAETKEQLGGFYLIAAADLDEALVLLESAPVPAGAFEIWPVMFPLDPTSL